MKNTWILFFPDPIDDEVASRYDKIEAIKKCLIKEFPGCKYIRKTISYNRKERFKGFPPTTALRVIIDRIDGLSTARYEGVLYTYRQTNLTWGPGVSNPYGMGKQEPMKDKLEFPKRLDIKKYLP